MTMIQKTNTQTTQDLYIPNPHNDIIENVPSTDRDFVIQEYEPAGSSSIRAYQIIWFGFGVIETLLVFRFVLEMVGANTYSNFTNLVYTLSYPFAAPFFGILPSTGNGIILIEWTTLIGMAVYLVITYGLLEVIHMMTPIRDNNTRSITRRTRYAL